jgi:hypothetical protein
VTVPVFHRQPNLLFRHQVLPGCLLTGQSGGTLVPECKSRGDSTTQRKGHALHTSSIFVPF